MSIPTYNSRSWLGSLQGFKDKVVIWGNMDKAASRITPKDKGGLGRGTGGPILQNAKVAQDEIITVEGEVGGARGGGTAHGEGILL